MGLFKPGIRILYYGASIVFIIGGAIYYYVSYISPSFEIAGGNYNAPYSSSQINEMPKKDDVRLKIVHSCAKTAKTTTDAFRLKGLEPQEVVTQTLKALNNAGTPDILSDDPKSPYNQKIPAYSTIPAEGVVTINYDSNTQTYIIKGHDENRRPFVTLTINTQT